MVGSIEKQQFAGSQISGELINCESSTEKRKLEQRTAIMDTGKEACEMYNSLDKTKSSKIA